MAIIYSYPKVTSPLATDVLVLTDTTLTAGKRKNKTKSLAMSDLAAYVVSSTSGITGGGTFNTIPLWTPDGFKLGDSIITQASTGQGVKVGGRLDVTGSTNINDLDVQGASTFNDASVLNGSVTINDQLIDGTGSPGTAGQVLSSTGGGDTAWISDAGGSVTGTGTTSNLTLWSDGPNGVLSDAPIKLGTGTGSLIISAGTTASGDNSTAMGNATTASGPDSLAIGYGSIATGDGSFAGAGEKATASIGGEATGKNTFAFGYLAKATSDGAIAIGTECEATSTNSVALGNNAIASNVNSFAAGIGAIASGQSSTAFGASTTASSTNAFVCGDNNTASGALSFAAGKGNTASGNGSIVMGGIGTGASTAAGVASAVFGGELNTANGENSTILGGQKNSINVNSQDSSVIGGEDNELEAGSTNSVVLGGIGLRGGGVNQTACGVANVSKNNCKFIVGVGTYTSPTNITRQNGFEVRDNGQISLGQYTGTNFTPVVTNSNDLLSVNAAGDVQQSRFLPRGIKVAPDPTTGTIAANVGAIRYRATSNNSYVEMIMQTSAFGYSWVIIKENSWT